MGNGWRETTKDIYLERESIRQILKDIAVIT